MRFFYDKIWLFLIALFIAVIFLWGYKIAFGGTFTAASCFNTTSHLIAVGDTHKGKLLPSNDNGTGSDGLDIVGKSGTNGGMTFANSFNLDHISVLLDENGTILDTFGIRIYEGTTPQTATIIATSTTKGTADFPPFQPLQSQQLTDFFFPSQPLIESSKTYFFSLFRTGSPDNSNYLEVNRFFYGNTEVSDGICQNVTVPQFEGNVQLFTMIFRGTDLSTIVLDKPVETQIFQSNTFQTSVTYHNAEGTNEGVTISWRFNTATGTERFYDFSTAGVSSTPFGSTATSSIFVSLPNGDYFGRAFLKINGQTVANSTTTTFTIAGDSTFTRTPSGIISLPSSTSTVSEANITCDEASGLFANSLCKMFIFLFIPSQERLDDFAVLKTNIENKPPIGYFNAIKNALSNVSTSTPTVDLSNVNGLSSVFSQFRTIIIAILWFYFGFWIFHRIKHLDL